MSTQYAQPFAYDAHSFTRCSSVRSMPDCRTYVSSAIIALAASGAARATSILAVIPDLLSSDASGDARDAARVTGRARIARASLAHRSRIARAGATVTAAECDASSARLG